MEDGVFVAMPDDVHVILRVLLSRRFDRLCVHATHPRARVERGSESEFSFLSFL